MNKEVLLEQLVEMMSAITEGTVRNVRNWYYVDPTKYSSSKLKKLIFPIVVNTLGKYKNYRNLEVLQSVAKGRIFVKQNKSTDGLVLRFYFTEKKYSEEELISLIGDANRLGNPRPKFFTGAVLLDDENITLTGVKPGKRIRYLRTASEQSDAVEEEYLHDLNRKIDAVGIGIETPGTIIIGDERFENVAGFVKNPDRWGICDFYAVRSSGEIVPGSGISHKAPTFEAYKNLISSDKKDASDFMEAAIRKWRIDILFSKDGPKRSTAGFYRPMKNRSSSRVPMIYGSGPTSADFLVLGEFSVKKTGESEVTISAEGIYQKPETPSGEYEPAFHSRFGPGGFKVPFSAEEIAQINFVNPPEGVTKEDHLKSMGVKIETEEVHGIEIVKSASISVRIMSKPLRRIGKNSIQV